ncbi:MAG: hypothetical protein ACXABD_12895, partial [Candidatus Thorarchaeota archaeon]
MTVKNLKEISLYGHNQPPLQGHINLDYLMKRTIMMFDRLLERGLISTREELEILGTYLFRVLFSDEDIGARFRYILDESENDIRVALEFGTESAELVNFPWEFLYLPDSDQYGKGFFLTAHPKVILARYFPLRVQLKPSEDSLRILLVISRPDDEEEVKAEPVIRKIRSLARNLDHVEVER